MKRLAIYAAIIAVGLSSCTGSNASGGSAVQANTTLKSNNVKSMAPKLGDIKYNQLITITSPTSEDLKDIKFVPFLKKYVGVGNKGTIISSVDGYTWQDESPVFKSVNNQNLVASTIRLNAIASGANGLVAVGAIVSGNGISTAALMFISKDGNNWQQISLDKVSADFVQLNSVVFADGSYFADGSCSSNKCFIVKLGNNSGVVYSIDASSTNKQLYGIGYGGGYIVAGGSAGTLITGKLGQENDAIDWKSYTYKAMNTKGEEIAKITKGISYLGAGKFALLGEKVVSFDPANPLVNSRVVTEEILPSHGANYYDASSGLENLYRIWINSSLSSGAKSTINYTKCKNQNNCQGGIVAIADESAVTGKIRGITFRQGMFLMVGDAGQIYLINVQKDIADFTNIAEITQVVDYGDGYLAATNSGFVASEEYNSSAKQFHDTGDWDPITAIYASAGSKDGANGNIYALSSEGEVYMSSDNGTTWSKNATLAGGANSMIGYVRKKSGNVLESVILVLGDGQLFEHVDADGDRWQVINADVASGAKLYAGAVGNSVVNENIMQEANFVYLVGEGGLYVYNSIGANNHADAKFSKIEIAGVTKLNSIACTDIVCVAVGNGGKVVVGSSPVQNSNWAPISNWQVLPINTADDFYKVQIVRQYVYGNSKPDYVILIYATNGDVYYAKYDNPETQTPDFSLASGCELKGKSLGVNNVELQILTGAFTDFSYIPVFDANFNQVKVSEACPLNTIWKRLI